MEGISGKVDRLIDAAIGSRPDLAAKTADVRASEAATMRAKADFLPKLSLQGTWNKETYGYNAQLAGVNGTFNGSQNVIGGFAVLSWDLFDGFERVEKVKKRQAEESAARAEAEAMRLETTRDVWTAYQDSLKARKQVEYAASFLTSTKETFDSVNACFMNGLATITDLVSSQSALAAARFEQAGAESDYLTSLASLSLAMGQITPEKGKKREGNADFVQRDTSLRLRDGDIFCFVWVPSDFMGLLHISCQIVWHMAHLRNERKNTSLKLGHPENVRSKQATPSQTGGAGKNPRSSAG